MGHGTGRAVLALALAGAGFLAGSAGEVRAQGFGAGPNPAAPLPGMSPVGAGGSLVNPYANPYANPYMNPFLNPWMTQTAPGTTTDSLMFFMAAQRARGGLGSPYAPGGSAAAAAPIPGPAPVPPPAPTQGGAAAQPGFTSPGAPGMDSGRNAGRSGVGVRRVPQPAVQSGGIAGRVPPSRPVPNTRVPGRFDDNPFVNDRRGLLSSRYSAYGASMTNQSGQPVTPGGAPVPNESVRRYFNHYPSYNR